MSKLVKIAILVLILLLLFNTDVKESFLFPWNVGTSVKNRSHDLRGDPPIHPLIDPYYPTYPYYWISKPPHMFYRPYSTIVPTITKGEEEKYSYL